MTKAITDDHLLTSRTFFVSHPLIRHVFPPNILGLLDSWPHGLGWSWKCHSMTDGLQQLTRYHRTSVPITAIEVHMVERTCLMAW